MSDGLAGNVVTAIREDSSETLWVGTTTGLSRRVGLGWVNYGADSLGGTSVRDITELAGLVWVIADSSISAFDGSVWTIHAAAQNAPADPREFLIDSSGDLWTRYGTGVSRFDGTRWVPFDAGASVRVATTDTADRLWVATDDALLRLDGAGYTTIPYPNSFFLVDGILVDRHGDVWTAGSRGVNRFVVSTGQWESVLFSISRRILEDHLGFIWAGGEHNALFYDGSIWRSVPGGSFTSGDAKRFFEDGFGNMWIVTDDGVVRFDRVNPARNQPEAGDRFTGFNTFASEHSGNVWIGSNDGLVRHDGLGPSWFEVPTGEGPPFISPDGVAALATDQAGTLWIATGSLWTLTDGQLAKADSTGSLPYLLDILVAGDSTLWFGGGRAVHFDGTIWSQYGSAEGIPTEIRSLAEDSNGGIYAGTREGVRVFNGSSFDSLAATPSLAPWEVNDLEFDSSGALWLTRHSFSVGAGLCRYQGGICTVFTAANGLSTNDVVAILRHRDGDLRFVGADGSMLAWNGIGFETLIPASISPCQQVFTAALDSAGTLWIGGNMNCDGIFRNDGLGWGQFTTVDGLRSNSVTELHVDRAGQVWAGHTVPAQIVDQWSLTRHIPDRVRPTAIVDPATPRLIGTRDFTPTLRTAYPEGRLVEFCYALDAPLDLGSCIWSGSPAASLRNLPDGMHELRVSARDAGFNIDLTPDLFEFEVDATPPVPVVTGPASGAAVNGVLAVRGTAADARFSRYSVEIRPDGGTWSLIASSTTPVTNDTLASWSSAASPDGNYQTRLTVVDSLGLSGIVTIPFIVDNEAPFADQTTPVRVRPATGGDVFTTRAEAHLFFPPNAFRDEAIVEILPPDSADACATAIPSAALGGADHLLRWDQPLHKDVLVDIAYAGAGSPAAGAAVYRCDAGVWTRVGGTPDASTGRISFATRTQGRYAVLADAGESVAPSGLAFLSMTPRVFSPGGGFSATDVAIAFSIPRAAGVSVKVFDRSGRLVRTVTDGAAMPAGSNVVRWNGRDLNGDVVADDLYLIGIEAVGERIIRTVAVVR